MLDSIPKVFERTSLDLLAESDLGGFPAQRSVRQMPVLKLARGRIHAPRAHQHNSDSFAYKLPCFVVLLQNSAIQRTLTALLALVYSAS